MNDMKLGVKLGLGFGIVLVLLLLVTLGAWRTIETYKVNGPVYQRIIQGKDLLADILPPPLYILESWETVQEMNSAAVKEEIAQHGQTLIRLKKEYDTRHDYWLKGSLEPELSSLMENAHKPVAAFFAMAQGAFMEQVQAGDREKMLAAMAQMETLYTSHRQGIDALVAYAIRRSEIAEKEAGAGIATAIMMINISSAVALLLGLMVAFLFSRIIVRQVGGEPPAIAALAAQVAEGDLTMQFDTSHSATGIYLAIQNMVERLRKVIGEVSTAAEQVAVSSDSIADSAQNLSQGAAEQAMSLETSASAITAMTGSCQLNTDSSETTQTIAMKASQDAAKGGGCGQSGGFGHEGDCLQDRHHRGDRTADQSVGLECRH